MSKFYQKDGSVVDEVDLAYQNRHYIETIEKLNQEINHLNATVNLLQQEVERLGNEVAWYEERDNIQATRAEMKEIDEMNRKCAEEY